MVRHTTLARLSLAASLLAVGFAAAGTIRPSTALGVVGVTAGVLVADDVPLDDRGVVLGAVPLVVLAVVLPGVLGFGNAIGPIVLVVFAAAAGVLLARATPASR